MIKKRIKLVILMTVFILFPTQWSYAIKNNQETLVQSETTESTLEIPKISSDINEESVSSNDETMETSLSEESVLEEDLTDKKRKNDSTSKNIPQQDKDGFWLVDSAASLLELLKDNQKLNFRLIQDIDLGSEGFELHNGTTIDGNNHILTYNKGNNKQQGFYITESNAEVTVKNVQVGFINGEGASGYYGVVTVMDEAVNVTLNFETIAFYSIDGRMIYNKHGKVLFKGQNIIEQLGKGSYSGEWAETNFIDIQSGSTKVNHFSLNSFGIIWPSSTEAGNPYGNQFYLIVRENTELTVTTNNSITYASLPAKIIVAEAGKLVIDKVSTATDAERNRFFYSPQSTVEFEISHDASADFKLPVSINLNDASGEMAIFPNADVSIDVVEGTIFSATASSKFKLLIDEPKKINFSSSKKGTLGLNKRTTEANLLIDAINPVRIKTYSSKTSSLPTAISTNSALALNVRGDIYSNNYWSEEELEEAELLALSNSQKIVISEITDSPEDVSVVPQEATAESVILNGFSTNNGSPATEVTFMIFSALQDINDLTKAKHIVNITEFDEHNTAMASNYKTTITGLNPNTQYWVQMLVTTANGESEYSSPASFTTQPKLSSITSHAFINSATISGELASDTGTWTDYSNGEALPEAGKPADYGGIYQTVEVEYSTNSTFPEAETKKQVARLSGEKNQLFTADLDQLESGTTYFVRLKVLDLTGKPVTLVSSPITEFQTIAEIIDVEVPIEMAFKTENQDLGTPQTGQIYSPKYTMTNKGNVAINVSLIGLNKKNEAANLIQLLDHEHGLDGTDDLALQLAFDHTSFYLTEELKNQPKAIGVLGTETTNTKALYLTGKYFNAYRTVVSPEYELVFKFEKGEK